MFTKILVEMAVQFVLCLAVYRCDCLKSSVNVPYHGMVIDSVLYFTSNRLSLTQLFW